MKTEIVTEAEILKLVSTYNRQENNIGIWIGYYPQCITCRKNLIKNDELSAYSDRDRVKNMWVDLLGHGIEVRQTEDGYVCEKCYFKLKLDYCPECECVKDDE